jgi:hypothetical protein
MLLFISVFGVPSGLDEILVVHSHQMIEQDFARLQEKAQHERIALVIGESPEVFGVDGNQSWRS